MTVLAAAGAAGAGGPAGTATQAVLVVVLLVLLAEREVVRARWAYRVEAGLLDAVLAPLWLAFVVVVGVRVAGWL